MRKNPQKKKKILEGHKRVGKRFIPPMMQIPTMRSTSYVNDMLPELIWIGLLNEKVGYVRAARIIEEIFLAADEVRYSAQQGNFALISTFGFLNQEQKDKFKSAITEKGLLDLIRNSLAPLILLYDGCPLKFLGLPTVVFQKEELISSIKKCVGRAIDKYDTPGIVLYGAMLLSRLVTGKIHFPAGMVLPDFNAVIDSPNSEEAKLAAGFMRANALAEFGMLDVDSTWAKYFWNRGGELSPCELSDSEQPHE